MGGRGGGSDSSGLRRLNTSMSRRQVGGVVATVLLAGCLSGGGSEDDGADVAAGDIELIIDEEPYDLSQDHLQAEHAEEYSMSFHFHEYDDRWHRHGAEPVTVGDGLDLLPGFMCEQDGDMRLEIEDAVYDASEPNTEISVTMNNESVEAFEYVPQDGDAIRIEISTG